ncbi:MAG: hypothetical protein GF311_09770 [Candidatus Lokiarchaeota archaeon]|nr:hypothetical protein [Candidatus Lokiarchaeota archaeon]
MSFESVTIGEFTRGLMSLVFVVVSLIIGIKLMWKYFKYKEKTFITVGLTWIFLSASWWHSAFNMLSLLFFDTPLNEILGLILVNAFIAPALITWMYSFGNLIYNKYKKEITIISLVIFGGYEILFFILLIIQPDLIATVLPGNIVQRTVLTFSFAIISIIIAIVAGLIISLEAIRTENQKIKWKGRFLLLAFALFTVGALLDSATWIGLGFIVFIRILLITSVITYYLGFFLPEWLANILIHKE